MIAVLLACGFGASVAHAGSYPMYQCDGASDPAIAPGWAFNSDSASSLSLANDCAQGSTFGVHGFYEGNLGEQRQSGGNGSTIDLSMSVPGSAPDVSIVSWSGDVVVPTVSGDEVFVGFHSAGQTLGSSPGLPVLYPGDSLSENYSVTLPQGAQEFDVSLFCSTSNSQPDCVYSNADQMPGLQYMTFTLSDKVPPTISAVAGSLSSAAQHQSVVSGQQTIQFQAADADSGVYTASLVLTPTTTGTPTTTNFNFAGQCTWSSWNACPTRENVGSTTLDTGTLKDGTYTVTLKAQDAAGNITSEPLGTITTSNAPTVLAPPTVTGAVATNQTLTASNGAFSAPSSAGAITITGQWLRCDAQGTNCLPIPGFTGTSYNPTAEDLGHMLRYQNTATDLDGSTVVQSSAVGPAGQTNNPTSSLGGGLTGAQPNSQPGSQSNTIGEGSLSRIAPVRIANGTPCSGPSMTLTINGRSETKTVLHYGQRVTVAGRLGCDSTPVAGATIALDPTGSVLPISLRTAADGTFVYHLGSGPSRKLIFTYTAYSTDSQPAASVTATIGILPKIALRIAPRNIQNGETITWRGKISGGPYPPGGVTLLVQVREGNRWQTFDELLTHNGSFTYRYTFRRTTRPTTYAFRIALPYGGSVGYAYNPIASKPIDVRVG